MLRNDIQAENWVGDFWHRTWMTPKMSTRQRRKKSENIPGEKKKKTLWAEEEKNQVVLGGLTENKDKNIAAMSQCIL